MKINYPIFLLALLPCLLVGNYVIASPNGFIENKGMLPEEVLYFSDTQDGRIYVTEKGLVFNFCDYPEREHSTNSVVPVSIDCHVSSILWPKPIINAQVVSKNSLGYPINYLNGSEHYSRVRAFTELMIKDIIPGFSLKLYHSQQQLKYDLILTERVNLNQVYLTYEGFDRLEVFEKQLLGSTSIGTFREDIPYSYVDCGDGRKLEQDVLFQLKGKRVYFSASQPGMGETLVIDPILIFSTYSGSTADNWGSTATYDNFGNLFAAGIVEVVNDLTFPVTNGAFQSDYGGGPWDVAISKYDSSGSRLIYSTYLGGSESEMVQSLVVNENNELLVLGVTSSLDFPTTDNAFDRTFGSGPSFTPIGGVPFNQGSDIFISKISEDGSTLLSSTFLGGSDTDGLMSTGSPLVKNYGDESRGDIYVNRNGEVLIASKTLSNDFPINSGIQIVKNQGYEAVVCKFSPDLSELRVSTFIGGEGADAAHSIKETTDGKIVVAGGTSSSIEGMHPNFLNTHAGGVDGWVAVISSQGDELLYGQYAGTNVYDQAYFTDLDPSDNIYIYGQTSGNYLERGDVFKSGQGQFVTKFSPDLQDTLVSTNFGSPRQGPDISPTAFLVNECNNIYLSGWGGFTNGNYIGGSTIDMPISTVSYQPVTSGDDFYLAVFIDDMEELLFSTYLGGGQNRTHVDGGTSRFDKRGIVYHSVCAGCVSNNGEKNSDFPSTPGAWSRTNNSPNCNNAAFKFDMSSLRSEIGVWNSTKTIENYRNVCMPEAVIFENRSVGGVFFEWDLGDGRKLNTSSSEDIFHTYTSPGTYEVKLKIIDQATCVEEDSTKTTVQVYQTTFVSPEDQIICEGESIQLEASGGNTYSWKDEEGTTLSSLSSITVTPTTSTYYLLNAKFAVCELNDTIFVTVNPKPDNYILARRDCKDGLDFEFSSESTVDATLTWTLSDGTSYTESEFIHSFSQPGTYTVNLLAETEFCRAEYIRTIQVENLLVPSVITPGKKDAKNDKFEIQGITEFDLVIYNRWGNEVYQSSSYQNNWQAEGVEAGTYYYLISKPDGFECKGWVQVIK